MILDRFKLTAQVAIVTGAGKGIGRGIALAFAEAGADIVCAARTEADIEDTAREVRARGRRALAVQTDVLETSNLERLVAATLEEFGRLDILVNNAGGTGPRAALETSEGFFERALRMNVTAGGGAIVNISSRSSNMVQTSFVAYAAGKAALNMMTRNLAAEIAPKVRINAIAVGGVETDALAVVLTNDALREQFETNTPMRRPGTVEDIAACALYLASPAGGWVTGKIYDVDGGTEAPSMTVPVAPL
jgi:7-alpha-hydroxysteroid dehydrogenase